mmetsp:Transcript_509/g.1674  ORF Transcript_509/g.1674 Transcript_509/m.1674 type:complete len:222 (-) Transcript_509:73-738(-)
MPPLWDLYAAAAGAPKLSSSASDSSCAWTRAVRRCLSAVEKEAASTTALMVCTMLLTLLVSTWASAAGFFRISRSMMEMARPRMSMDSMSSASLDLKSPCSFSRIVVALFRSASSEAMLPASSSTFADDASMSPACLEIAACNFSFEAWAVLISNCLFLAASSHQATNSLYAFSSASPCFVTFAASSSSNVSTDASGFVAAANGVKTSAEAARNRVTIAPL